MPQKLQHTRVYYMYLHVFLHIHSGDTPTVEERRYPKRRVEEKKYTEEELSDEDEYLCKFNYEIFFAAIHFHVNIIHVCIMHEYVVYILG